MDESDEEFQKRFEIFANTQAADLEAIRAILESLIILVFGTFPRGNEMVVELQKITLTTLREERDKATDTDAKRKAALALAQAEPILKYLIARVAEAQKPPVLKN
jgi:hypothetical protein